MSSTIGAGSMCRQSRMTGMTRIVLKMLMAATALVPVAATAQRGPDSQVERRGGWNGQRGDDLSLIHI